MRRGKKGKEGKEINRERQPGLAAGDLVRRQACRALSGRTRRPFALRRPPREAWGDVTEA